MPAAPFITSLRLVLDPMLNKTMTLESVTYQNTLEKDAYAGILVRLARESNRIYYGRIGADGPLRSSADVMDVVYKLAWGEKQISALYYEYGVYNKFAGLQGKYLPRCWGIFSGEYEGLEVACLVLEKGSGQVSKELKLPGYKRSLADAMIKLHRHYGIQLNKNIQHRSARFNMDTFLRNHVITIDGAPRIHGFSHAMEHHCPGPFCDELKFCLSELCE